MKAPNKIVVCIPQRLNLSSFNEDSKYVGMAYTDKGNLTSPQTEEYIRKDTLLEWLKEKHDNTDNMDVRISMTMIIDKLQTL